MKVSPQSATLFSISSECESESHLTNKRDKKQKYYPSLDHISTGTWAVELPVANRANKSAINAINRPLLEHIDPAIFLFFLSLSSAKP